MKKSNECEIIQDLLLGYVDNTLNPESKKLVEKHISECEECKVMLQDIIKDTESDKENQQKEIDYLKKIRIKTKIKSIVIALSIIFVIIFGIYANKFIQINSIMRKGSKSLDSQNYYCEQQESISNLVTVKKTYYKDGKFKRTCEVYSAEGVEKYEDEYGIVDSNKIIKVNEEKKVVSIIEDHNKLVNQESSIKYDRYKKEERESFYSNLSKTFNMEMHSEHFRNNKEYYVFRYKYKDTDKFEVHIDKETGLVIKTIEREAEELHYPFTNVVMQVNDRITTYKHEFGIVKDEDVEVPDLTKYEMN